MTADQKLTALGIVLPTPHAPTRHHLPNYRGHRLAGPFLFVGAQGPFQSDGVTPCSGRVGEDVSVEEAYRHARNAGLYILAEAKAALGSLDRVAAVVKLVGMVNAVPDFKDHPLVVNGCSDLLVEVFGPERGPHPRTSMGVGSLPHRMTVEIEAVMLVRTD